MTDDQKAFLDQIVDGWEQALHNVDSLWQVVQLVPDWQTKLEDALNDPLRIQATTDRFAPVRELAKLVKAGKTDTDSAKRALEAMRRTN